MLKRKAFIRWMVPVLLLFAQWCYGQDSADVVMGDSTAVMSAPAEDVADTLSQAIETLYQPVLRQVPDSFTARLRAEKDFAYANDPAYWHKKVKEPSSPGFWYYVFRFLTNDATRVIFYTLLAGILLYALYRIVLVNKLFIFYSPSGNRKGNEEELVDMSEGNMDEKIRQAMEGKDYRTAIRYLYLKVLRGLHHKGHIAWDARATNDDYARQMSGHPAHTEFAFLTRVYDYVWYGGLEISEAQFGSVYDNFQNFYRSTAA